jgi:hypothetical protein
MGLDVGPPHRLRDLRQGDAELPLELIAFPDRHVALAQIGVALGSESGHIGRRPCRGLDDPAYAHDGFEWHHYDFLGLVLEPDLSGRMRSPSTKTSTSRRTLVCQPG